MPGKAHARLAAAATGALLWTAMWRWIYWGEAAAAISNVPLALAAFSTVGAVLFDAARGARRRAALGTLLALAAWSLADVTLNLRPSNQIACAVAVAEIERRDRSLPAALRHALWLLVPFLAAVKVALWGTAWDVIAGGLLLGAGISAAPRILFGADPR